MATRRDAALEYHEQGRPGKIAVVPTKPVGTQRDLSLAYTPGVGDVCKAIAAEPADVFRYTARGNLVAVVTNGTAVLGLGNLGPLAAKPVMEGKAVLFKRFADLDVFDIEVNSRDAAEIVRFCEMLEPTVGGINLEDIAAPDCFYIEEKLKEKLDIPVFHDDQHGTAIITGAALLNALELTGKSIAEVQVVFSGAGAAAISTAEHYVRLGVGRGNILMVDRHGVITTGRLQELDRYKARFARDTDRRTLADALRGADVFVGLSAAGIVDRAMVASMADRPIIFALANPDPEIMPEEVRAVRDDAIIATGRTDYPNQVNNVLGFPFIFRGALDVRARCINEEMKMAATRALAKLAKEDVPEAVAEAYGESGFRFGPDYLIPKPFDPRVLLWVAPAVARAALETGVARIQVDPEEYRNGLEARLGRRREVMRDIILKAKREPKKIVFPEGENERIQRAAVQVLDEGIGQPILLGRPEKIQARARANGIDLTGIEMHVYEEYDRRVERYAQKLFVKRQRKGLTLGEARARMRLPIYFGCMMVEEGDADGLVGGENTNYPETIRPALEVIGTAPDSRHVAGLYIMVLQHDIMFFADTTVNIDPDAETLAEIALMSASFVTRLGIRPALAMLSFSNFGSTRHPQAHKVAEAVEIVKSRAPNLTVEGEMQVDVAVLPDLLQEQFPFSRLKERANVLIFPDLDSANIAYKLLWRLGGAEAIGPILLGMDRPIHVLQRDASAADIVNLSALAVVDAQRRAPRQPT